MYRNQSTRMDRIPGTGQRERLCPEGPVTLYLQRKLVRKPRSPGPTERMRPRVILDPWRHMGDLSYLVLQTYGLHNVVFVYHQMRDTKKKSKLTVLDVIRREYTLSFWVVRGVGDL